MERDARGLVLLGLMGGLFLAAMDATILAIAMPDVVADLGGEHLYAWGFTTYMLAAAVSMPVLGALSDAHGRKRFFLGTMGVFVLGSVACGLSPDMPTFLVARFLQGIGGGGMLSIPFAMAGALFQGPLRGRALGRLSGVWGVASIAGPLMGGAAVRFLSWEWVFYVNIPVGLLGAWLVARHHVETEPPHGRRVDLWGALLLMAGVAALLLSLEDTVPSRPAFALAGAALVAAFFWRERGAPAPILPLPMLRRRPILVANVAAMLAALAIFVPIVFAPRYVEATYGAGTSIWAVFPLSIAWSGASMAAGRHLRSPARVKAAALAGLALLTSGLAAGPFLFTLGLGLVGVALACTWMGLGIGLATPALLLSVQNAVALAQMGTATASQAFLRNLGGASGIVAIAALVPRGSEASLAGVALALETAALVAGVGLLVVVLGLRTPERASAPAADGSGEPAAPGVAAASAAETRGPGP